MGKFKYIRDFENLGLKIPYAKGGSFHPGFHMNGVRSVLENFAKYEKEYDRSNGCLKQYTAEWNNEFSTSQDKLVLSEKDLLAYKHWNSWDANETWDTKDQSLKLSLSDPLDFTINYLNCAKIGNYVDPNHAVIVTNDPTPLITFEPWIKEGFNIMRNRSYPFDFDVEKKRFFIKERSLMQVKANDEKREELEELLRRRIIEK